MNFWAIALALNWDWIVKEAIANMESFSFVANFEVYVVNETGKKVKKRGDNGIVYKVLGDYIYPRTCC